MTIIEVEQGIRNLIAMQPMIMSGQSGDFINSILPIIDSTKSLSFRSQAYPFHDNLKFSLTNEVFKIENNIANWITQAFQERGINLTLYINQSIQQFSGIAGGQYMPMGQQMQPQMMNQQMYSSRTMPQQMMGQYQSQQSSSEGDYSRSAQQKNYKTIEKTDDSPIAKRKNESYVDDSDSTDEQPTKSKKSSKPSPAEALMGEPGETGDPNAAGRDYLMELLKK